MERHINLRRRGGAVRSIPVRIYILWVRLTCNGIGLVDRSVEAPAHSAQKAGLTPKQCTFVKKRPR